MSILDKLALRAVLSIEAIAMATRCASAERLLRS